MLCTTVHSSMLHVGSRRASLLFTRSTIPSAVSSTVDRHAPCHSRARTSGKLCHQRSPTGTTNDLRTGHARVDPLPETSGSRVRILRGAPVKYQLKGHVAEPGDDAYAGPTGRWKSGAAMGNSPFISEFRRIFDRLMSKIDNATGGSSYDPGQRQALDR